MTMSFEEAKFWSTMTVEPVKTEHNLFYWQGWLMSKEMVFNLLGSFFMDSSATPSMKEGIYNLTVERIKKHELDSFQIEAMSSDMLWQMCKSKAHRIILKNGAAFKKYEDNPFLIIELIYGDS